MKKFLLSIFVVLTFSGFVYRERLVSSDDEVNVITPMNQMMGGSQMMSNKYKDGEFTGIVADAYYGPMQVKAIISGGKITDVLFLQYPNDRRTSIEINSQAMPYLKQEAIQSQSAKVDIVSGATQSSNGFRETLQSALNKALKS